MSTKTLYREEIHVELDELGKMELGSDQHRATADVIVKLTNAMIELERVDNDRIEAENRERELDLKEQQAIKEEKHRKLEFWSRVGLGAASLLLTYWGTKYTTNFERDDTMTYTAGKEHFKALHRFKFW